MPLTKPTPPAAIPAIPTPVPQRSDMANFAVRGDATMTALPGSVDGMNAATTYVSAAVNFAEEQVTLAAAQVTLATTQAGNADTARIAAQAAAVSATNAPGTNGTSTTSMSVGSGVKSFTTQTGKAWVVGQPVMIARTSAAAATYMIGTVTAYTAGTGAMSVTVAASAFGGAGTFTDWTISLTGPRGAAGVKPLVSIAVNTTAIAGNRYMLTASCVLTLPFAPAVGDAVQFSNLSGTLTASVDPGAELINGTAGAMMLDNLYAAAELTYSGATKGWIF